MIRHIPVEIIIDKDSKGTHPAAFIFENEEIRIADVVDRWYQGDNNPEFPESDYFKVRGMNGAEYLLKHELGGDKWFICIPGLK